MIRRAALADAAEILRVHIASIRAVAASHYSPQQIDAWCGARSVESYADPIMNKVVFVAVGEGGILGFGQLDPVASVIEAVYVEPGALRQGIGTRLLLALEAHAVRLQLTRLTLDASLNAVAFYMRAGYMRVGDAAHELKPGVSIPSINMVKVLSDLQAAPLCDPI